MLDLFQTSRLTSYHVPSRGLRANMKRREFIGLISGAALAWPSAARAQQKDKIPRVAFLGPSRSTPAQVGYYTAFFSQLEKHDIIPIVKTDY